MGRKKKARQGSSLELASKAFRNGQFEKAVKYYSATISQAKIDGTLSSTKASALYASRSACYFQLSAAQDAILAKANGAGEESFREQALVDAKLSVANSASSMGYHRAGQAAELMGHLKEAEEYYRVSLTICNDEEVQQAMLGVIAKQGIESKTDKRLRSWLGSSGGTFPKLFIEEVAIGNRTVRAHVQIQAEEEVIVIPRDCCMPHQIAAEHLSLAQELLKTADMRKKFTPTDFHAMWLLMDASQQASFHHPYYLSLPTYLKNFPQCWTDAELKWLEGSDLLRQVKSRVHSLREMYDLILGQEKTIGSISQTASHIKQFSSFSFEEWRWAKLLAISRNFKCEIDGVQSHLMVPAVDLLNHKRPADATWDWDDARQSFVLTTNKEIAMGGEIEQSYGAKPNGQLLLNYGFVLESNVDPTTRRNLNDCWFAPLIERPLTLPSGAVLPAMSHRVSAHYDTDITLRLMFSYLRCYCALQTYQSSAGKTSHPILDHSQKHDFNSNVIQAISCGNELAVLSTLQRYSEAALRRYPTTFAQDCRALKSCAEFSNERSALILVMGEKQVLHHFRQLLFLCEALLQKDTCAHRSERRLAQLLRVLSAQPELPLDGLRHIDKRGARCYVELVIKPLLTSRRKASVGCRCPREVTPARPYKSDASAEAPPLATETTEDEASATPLRMLIEAVQETPTDTHTPINVEKETVSKYAIQSYPTSRQPIVTMAPRKVLLQVLDSPGKWELGHVGVIAVKHHFNSAKTQWEWA